MNGRPVHNSGRLRLARYTSHSLPCELYYTGLDEASLTITANFPLGDVPAGTNLASRAKPISQGVWEIKLGRPIKALKRGRLTVTIKDEQGNKTRVERAFSVEGK